MEPRQPGLYTEAKAFLNLATVYALDRPITEQTIHLRQYKTKTPDATIAATALVHGLTVITQNTEDFMYSLSVSPEKWADVPGIP